MNLYLIRLPVCLSALAQWAGDRGWTHPKGGDFDAGRALHHLLCESFGKGAIQPFRLMVVRGRDRGQIYGYAALPADALRDMADAIMLPEAGRVVDLAALQSKPMPAFRAGQCLGINVVTRPVRRLRQPFGRYGAGAEIDTWLLSRLRANPEADPDPGRHDRSPAYLDWLAERLAPAAELSREASTVAGMQRRKVARGSASIEGPDVTFHATITVADPHSFTQLLRGGLGRHSAYGYGMLLLRAPNAPVPKG